MGTAPRLCCSYCLLWKVEAPLRNPGYEPEIRLVANWSFFNPWPEKIIYLTKGIKEKERYKLEELNHKHSVSIVPVLVWIQANLMLKS